MILWRALNKKSGLVNKYKIMNIFDIWNWKKQLINNQRERTFYVKPKEVWYASIGQNIWFESYWKWDDFKRPVLVLAKIWNMFLVATMTTKWKDDSPFYYKISDSHFWKPSYVTFSQIKTIDKKRFIEKIWKIDSEEFKEIKNKVREYL